jgi:NADPH:quinone reductase-like Zn-dependent oxidoreductase
MVAQVSENTQTCSQTFFLIPTCIASVGQFAIQLAHLSGYKVVTTASPYNFELVKSLGADAMFDVSLSQKVYPQNSQ